MEVTLNVFWISVEMTELISLGHSVDVSKCTVEERTFYMISNVSPFEGNFCEVVSDGCDYIANESFESVKKKIRESREKILFNSN